MLPARVRVIASAVTVCAAMAVPARAGSLPPRAEVGLPSGVDVVSFRRLVSSRYHVEYRVVVAADIDRDGDLDVLASTDHGVTVWVNDGAGHLRAQRLPHGPSIQARTPANTWRGREERVDPTIPGDGPSGPVLIARAHAPPFSDSRTAAVSRSVWRLAFHARQSSPRAPPSRRLSFHPVASN